MTKKDVMFWFVLLYVVAILTLFVLVDAAKASSLSATVAILTALVTAQVGAIGWNINTDKKIAAQNNTTPPVDPTAKG